MKGDHLGEFEELVLLAVQGLHTEAYGVSVQQVLSAETSRDVSLGAVYAALAKARTNMWVVILEMLAALALLPSQPTPMSTK
jgi:hypothetical protein